MQKFLFTWLAIAMSGGIQAQLDAGLFRYPDVSETQITFCYANDLWVAPKSGGMAIRLSSPAGVESFPKFSPDGRSIAFTGNYDGNPDVYVIPADGGVPLRLTQHSYLDRVVDWTTDGKSVLFASGRESEKARFNQLFTIPANAGTATKLPLAYGEFASYSPDGKQVALTFRSEVFRTWKRYRGGDVADIYIFNLQDLTSYNISSDIAAGEEFPMWWGDAVYFITDNGPEKRMNLWRYDIATKSRAQLTHFTDYDVHFPSLGKGEIIFEAGGKLYLYRIADGSQAEIRVDVVSDKAALKPRMENVANMIQHINIGRDGKRILVEARGDIFSVPAENGYVKNLTHNSATAERYPAWSPDGKTIAYWSDASGEYALYLADATASAAPKKITGDGKGYRYNLFWSPDSKMIAFIDQAMRIQAVDVNSGAISQIDQGLRWAHYNLEDFSVSWSPDSRYITYSRDLDNGHLAAFVYDVEAKKTRQITSGFYSAYQPIFDPEGKYIYLLTSQSFNPVYSDLDNTFAYANSTQVAAISLQGTTPSLLAAKNDMTEVKKEEEKKAEAAKEEDKKKKDDNKLKQGAAEEEDTLKTVIEWDGLEHRLVVLPVSPGNYGTLSAVAGKIVFMHYPNAGSPADAKGSLQYYDIEKREVKSILDAADDYMLSADGSKILVAAQGQFAIITPEEGQKFEKPLRIAEMEMLVDPVQEWHQLFMDTWRIERDYFYDANMHGVNWEQVKQRYLIMLEGATTREEVNFVLGEMIAELNASHAYRSGGDLEETLTGNVGYLGVNWKADGQHYRIDNIIRAAPWDAEVRSPLDMPGIAVKDGDYILAVNGVPLTTDREPYAFFAGLASKTVELTYNTTPSMIDAKTVIVTLLDDEGRLRNLNWMDANRRRVEEATKGQVGYIYVPSTGVDGQNELIRQFTAQIDKKALIIDERFNNGGQIPDRFIEMLDRDPLVYWAIRDGKSWQWPPTAHFGPKVMLINGWSGSGGDAFPDYFRRKGLGPLIGQRTWGGLIGISGVPTLIDGGDITAPTFRMYYPDGTWFKEGHGVDPDILVEEDLTSLAKGKDVQLERAIEEALKLIQVEGYQEPKRPAPEVR